MAFECIAKPAAIHIAVTRLTVPVVDEFLNDLKEAVKELVEAGSAPSSSTSDTSVLYGVAGSVKTVGVADRLAAGFWIVCTKSKKSKRM